MISKTLVPLAVPLLLLDADIRKCFAVAGSLLKAFLVGSVGTIVGTLVAYWAVPMKSVVGAPKIAAALCARHIGGAVNFVAVADILRVPAELVAAAIAADNLIIAFYFSFLFFISAPSSADDSTEVIHVDDLSGGSEVSLASLSAALTTSLLICSLSMGLSHLFSISHMLLLSGITVALATALPGTFGPLARAGSTLGVLFMQLFFAATGAIGHIPTVLRVAPSVLLHTSVQILVHFLVTVGAGRLLRIPFRQLVLASNANVGGPTTASAMAVNKKWRQLVLPALLTGIFGFAIATQIGIVIYKLLLRS